MKPGELPKSTWMFRSASVDFRVRWSWKRFEDRHVVREASEPFHSLSEAMADARKHGFNDAHDGYSIF
jgi:hypothetical protein